MTKELSIFVDESGDVGKRSNFYLIVLVFHDQSFDIQRCIRPYITDLQDKRLKDIPMHAGLLLTGHKEYEGLSVDDRKKYLSEFRIFTNHVPFEYLALSYKKSMFSNKQSLFRRMKRDLVNSLFDSIESLQRFDEVKIYYDNGQAIVTKALHDAIEYVLAKNAVVYRDAHPNEYRLLQIADYLCTLELTALKYQGKTESATDKRFFGEWGSFKKNYLKKIRKKRLN